MQYNHPLIILQVQDRLEAIRCTIFLDLLDAVRVSTEDIAMKDWKKRRSHGINGKVLDSVVDSRQANTYHGKEEGVREMVSC